MIAREALDRLKRRPASTWLAVLSVLSVDLLLVWASLFLSLAATGAAPSASGLVHATVLYGVPVSGVACFMFVWRRLYRISNRFLGVYDVLNIAFVAAALGISLRLVEIVFNAPISAATPWVPAILFGFFSATFLTVARLYPRLVEARHLMPISGQATQAARRTLIVGAGDAGEAVFREITRPGESRYKVVGFVDDDPAKQRSTIHGVSVYGGIDDLPELASRLSVSEIMIAIPTASGPEMRRISQQCMQTTARVRTLPSISSFVNGNARVLPMLREMNVEDLVRRETLETDSSKIACLITGKRVLITGAGGSIGSELSRQVSRLVPSSLVLLGRGENSIFEIDHELRSTQAFHGTPVICDVRNTRNLGSVFDRHSPEVVIHAAAHKHVPLMESAPIEAI